MEILKKCQTYIPAQDKNRKFLERSLGEISTTTTMFEFTYPETVTRAKSVDVIWFNSRKMPEVFFEVEFEKKKRYSSFETIADHIQFIDYDFVSELHAKSCEIDAIGHL